MINSGFGELGVACWPLVPKFAGRSRRIFKGEKILSTPSFGREVKPRSHVVNLRHVKIPKWRGSRHFGKITGQHSRPQFTLPPLGTLKSWRTWRQLKKWEHLKKAGESNGKLPLRTCTGYSVPEPYQSPDWALVSAQTGPRAEYL